MINLYIIINNLFSFTKKVTQRVGVFILFSLVLFQYGNAQCVTSVDTVCIDMPDTLFTNSNAAYSSYSFFTNHSATLSVLPGDTMVTIDWATSSILNGIDSVCVEGIRADPSCGKDTICVATYLEACTTPCPLIGPDKDNDGVPDYVDIDDDNDGN